MAIGWISIHRKIQECFLWVDDEPFDRRSAWVDLLLLANHEDKKVLFDGKTITVQRGQRITSVRHLSERWHWSPKKTLNFLRLLESEQMIVKKSDNRKTLLTIVNYGIYQGEGNTEETLRKHSGNTNNNDNNENNDNNDNNENKIGRKIPPTYEMVRDYCLERANGIDPQSFIDFYESKGWCIGKNKMKDWRAAVRTWEGKRNTKPLQNINERWASVT